MIAGSIVGADQTLSSLRAFRESLSSRIGRVVGTFGLDVLALAKRLSPLKTGRLRRSIHLELSGEGDKVQGTVGTNVEYAGAFEYGLKGAQSVRGFMRSQTMAWGHPITPQLVSVRPFTRNVDRAARPFLNPALQGVQPPLAERLRADLRAAVAA